MPKRKKRGGHVNLADRTRAWMEVLDEEASYHRARLDSLPSSTALIIIDMQRYFLERNGHAYLPMGRAVIPNVARLRDAFRERGMKVVYTRHGHTKRTERGQMSRWWADLLMAGDPQADIVPEFAPRRGEPVIHKQHYDAFRETDLLDRLRGWGTTHLIVSGVMTHLCCETTARSAFMSDFEVALVVDGTGSSDEARHMATLESAAHGFAVPFTTDEIIARLPVAGVSDDR